MREGIISRLELRAFQGRVLATLVKDGVPLATLKHVLIEIEGFDDYINDEQLVNELPRPPL